MAALKMEFECQQNIFRKHSNDNVAIHCGAVTMLLTCRWGIHKEMFTREISRERKRERENLF
jgi:hypothetical protein